MAFNTEIITSTQIRDTAGNALYQNINFDITKLDKYILGAQRFYVRTALGDDFYDEILDQVETTATLTSDNSTLLDEFVRPMLSWFVVYDAWEDIITDLANQGNMANYTEFSNGASPIQSSRKRDSYMVQGERWKKDMIKYIKDQQDADSSKYPLYSNEDDTQVNKKGVILY